MYSKRYSITVNWNDCFIIKYYVYYTVSLWSKTCDTVSKGIETILNNFKQYTFFQTVHVLFVSTLRKPEKDTKRRICNKFCWKNLTLHYELGAVHISRYTNLAPSWLPFRTEIPQFVTWIYMYYMYPKYWIIFNY